MDRPISAPTMRKLHNEALPILLDLISGKIEITDQRVRSWYARYAEAPRAVVVLRRVE